MMPLLVCVAVLVVELRQIMQTVMITRVGLYRI